MVARRTRIEIINDMLLAMVRLGGRIKPTHLMYKSNLSHALMKDYISELIANDLMKEASENVLLKLERDYHTNHTS